MSWFKQHLNWTLFLAWLFGLITWIPIFYLDLQGSIVTVFAGLSTMAVFVVMGIEIWYLKQKRQSFWFLVTCLAPYLLPLVLLALQNRAETASKSKSADSPQQADRMTLAAFFLAVLGGVGNSVVSIVALVSLFKADFYNTGSEYIDTVPLLALGSILISLVGMAGGWLGKREPLAGGILLLISGMFILLPGANGIDQMASQAPGEILAMNIGNLVGGSFLTLGGMLDVITRMKSAKDSGKAGNIPDRDEF